MAESFFLDPDEAKSMGNIDYMRTARKVKKSYPTTKAWGAGFEQETITSALSKGEVTPSTFEIEQKAAEALKPEVAERRKASSDLDMFRNMAKDIRKK
ncbi:hypothetical protein [Altericista sp. CCNU0014]|uniref:hypothetical protein n=1 Tax=Altericista sp. CCNU0014 TaxID=3082949 RepID=UPI00384D9A92